jgi:hypothetical protein
MNPSLLLIPDRYKAAKLYSQIPDSGAGDLTFARNSNATRVNSAGLIEKVRTNLILQSEAFDTTWALNALPTITANTTVAPDGTTTGDTIAASGANSGVYQVPTVASGVEHSFSVYIKNISAATDVLLGCDLNPINATINFNASTGAIISTGAGITGSSVTNAGNGWYRVAGTYVTTGTPNTFVVFGTGVMSFAAWGAQFETGVTTPYIPTTTAAVSVGITANIPRLDYTGGGCPSLLLEPQRTNLALFSEQFNNAAWPTDGNGAGEIKTANYSISPEGYQNADRIQLNRTGGSYSRVRQDIVAVGAHTGSIYLKSNTSLSQKIWLRVDGNTATKITITTSWQRFVVSGSPSAALELFIDNTDAEIATIADFSAWGAQVEAGSYVSSYIPTLGSSVTRLADAASKTGISSLIGQTAGTIYFEVQVENGFGFQLGNSTSGGDFINSIQIAVTPSSTNAGCHVAGVAQVNNASAGRTGRQKVALAYALNDYAMYINGSQIFTDTAALVPLTSAIIFNHPDLGTVNGKVIASGLYATRLSNAELQSLTSL